MCLIFFPVPLLYQVYIACYHVNMFCCGWMHLLLHCGFCLFHLEKCPRIRLKLILFWGGREGGAGGKGVVGGIMHVPCTKDLPSLGGAWEQPPRGAPWVSALVGHFVQTWPDSECSHTVQFLDCSELNWRCNHYHLFWHCMTLLLRMCR